MQRKTKWIIAGASAAGLAALALGGFAVAHSRHDGMGHGMMEGHGRGHGKKQMAETFIARYDTNKDNKITQEEINASRTLALNEADANKDGKLGLDEFQSLWLKAQRESMVREFQNFDNDGDANVTLEEYRSPLDNIVSNMDQNNDGALSQDDLNQHGERHGWGKRMRNWMQGEGTDTNL
jgi:Ca2+-binding EF-hand superfamily protein